VLLENGGFPLEVKRGVRAKKSSNIERSFTTRERERERERESYIYNASELMLLLKKEA
jgi:hypothetical protein